MFLVSFCSSVPSLYRVISSLHTVISDWAEKIQGRQDIAGTVSGMAVVSVAQMAGGSGVVSRGVSCVVLLKSVITTIDMAMHSIRI